MASLGKYLALSALVFLFLIPTTASALIKPTSFGGRVLTVVPCSTGGLPGLHITIFPAGLFPVSYIWTPYTATKLYGPPILPGQQVLGLADTPFVCFIGFGGFFSSPIPLYGLRMTMVGTSLPGKPIPVTGF